MEAEFIETGISDTSPAQFEPVAEQSFPQKSAEISKNADANLAHAVVEELVSAGVPNEKLKEITLQIMGPLRIALKNACMAALY